MKAPHPWSGGAGLGSQRSLDRGNRQRGTAQTSEPGGDVIEIEGITITHADKCLFPEAGLTKEGVARYYQRIAGELLPWAQDRPLTFEAYPEWHHRRGLFQQKHTRPLPGLHSPH